MSITLEQLLSDYRDQNGGSYQLWRRAHESLPGGNTRTGVHVDPFPIYTEQGAGVHVTDVDGNKRLDLVCNATALILGHAHPDVVSALQSRAAVGTAISSQLSRLKSAMAQPVARPSESTATLRLLASPCYEPVCCSSSGSTQPGSPPRMGSK